MGIGADQGVGESHPLAVLLFAPHRPAKVFEVYLVANTGTRRYYAEAAECLLPPAQKDVALMVALHLKPDVLFKSIIVTKTVYGDRVVNHQVDGRKRVHFGGIAAKAFDRFAHRRQVHHGRNPGKVLHQDARRTVGNLPVGMGMLQPSGQGMNIFGGHGIAVLPAQQVFQ